MFSFEILEVQFDFPHIFIKISRRHNCFSGRYGLCTVVNTDQNDRYLSLKGDVIKPFFQFGFALRVPSGVIAR